MKKGWYFFFGIFTGIVLTIILSVVVTNDKGNITYYDEPGEILTNRSITVFQTSPNGKTALVSHSGNGGPNDQVFYFYQTGKASPLYDGQVIMAPVGKVFRIVGVHSYNTNYGVSTIPVITLVDRKENSIPKR